jgi:hypothetical protein
LRRAGARRSDDPPRSSSYGSCITSRRATVRARRRYRNSCHNHTKNLFACIDVRENVARRDVMHEPVLDESGRKYRRRRAPARAAAAGDLYYLLSCGAIRPRARAR